MLVRDVVGDRGSVGTSGVVDGRSYPSMPRSKLCGTTCCGLVEGR